jgi:hypothetical protein
MLVNDYNTIHPSDSRLCHGVLISTADDNKKIGPVMNDEFHANLNQITSLKTGVILVLFSSCCRTASQMRSSKLDSLLKLVLSEHHIVLLSYF